jgi:hypothetical protein
MPGKRTPTSSALGRDEGGTGAERSAEVIEGAEAWHKTELGYFHLG